MITTLMPHLRIGPNKEGVLIEQIQMPFHAVGHSFPYELLTALIYIAKERRCNEDLRGIGNFQIERVIRELRRFF